TQGVDAGQDPSRVLDYDIAGQGHPHAACLPGEQRVPGGGLDRGDLPRDGRLGIAEQPRRGSERPGQRYLAHHPQAGDGQLAHAMSLAIRMLHGIDVMVSSHAWILPRPTPVDTGMSSKQPQGKETAEQIMTSQVTGVWRLRSAARTAHGSTSDWFGAHPDGLLIFTDDLHFTEAVTQTDLPPAASGDRLSATPQENRALARGTLGSYGTYTAGDDGSLAGQHILGSTFPDWNNTTRRAGDVQVTVRDGLLRQALRLGNDDTVELTWEYAGTANASATPNQVAGAWRLDSARADTPGGTVQ